MTEDGWDRHRIYVYRRWPRISKAGEPHYVGVHREAIDEEFIKRLYGSGRYLLKLNDQRRTVDEHPLEIMDLNSPPKLSPDEIMDAPENERYFKLWPAQGKKNPTDSSADGAAVHELAGLLKTVIADRGKQETEDVKQTLVNWALEQTAKDREQNSPAALANLVTALKDVLLAQAKESRAPEGSEMLAIIGTLKSMQPAPQDPIAVLAQAKDLFAPSESAKGQDEISRLDQILSFATKLANLRGGNAGARSGWEIGLDYGKDLVLPLAQVVQNFMAMRNGGMMPALAVPGMVPGAAPTAPTAFDPYRNPELARQFARTMNAQNAAPQTGTPTGTPPNIPPSASPNSAAPPPADELGALVQMYGGLILGQLNMGSPGYVFADHITALIGNGMHAQICAQGEPALVQALLAAPEIAMFGEARLKKWVHEFVNFEEFLDEENADEEEGAATAGKL